MQWSNWSVHISDYLKNKNLSRIGLSETFIAQQGQLLYSLRILPAKCESLQYSLECLVSRRCLCNNFPRIKKQLLRSGTGDSSRKTLQLKHMPRFLLSHNCFLCQRAFDPFFNFFTFQFLSFTFDDHLLIFSCVNGNRSQTSISIR